jgi:hypothetical protein
VIDWRAFNIAVDEHVNFDQQAGNSSITVNRVTPSMNDQQPYHVELVSVFLKQGFVFLVFCTYDLLFLS